MGQSSSRSVIALIVMAAAAACTATGRAVNPASSAPKTVSTQPPHSAMRSAITRSDASEVATEHSALRAISTLVVKGRAPRSGYTRAQFGPAWADTDRNGCDTRNDVMKRDLVSKSFKPGTRDCAVLTGQLEDPYSGTLINFQRGQGTSKAVQIDHVVALSDAWQKGAQAWPSTKRVAFANDPMNLLAVLGRLNIEKRDGDSATWLPPREAFRCSYVARQVGVKAKYGLWVTPAERDAMVRILSNCPSQPLPASIAPLGGEP